MSLARILLLGGHRKATVPVVRSEILQGTLLKYSFLNLLLVAILGLVLRAFPLFPSFPLTYKNILHGHSHFAFGGWVMPILYVLVLKNFKALRESVAFRHWRNIAILMLASAYGMLFAFPMQGYKAASIAFSTLSLISGSYWAIVSWRASRQLKITVAQQFLNAGLFYHMLSALGPFATGPLIAMGKAGTPLYFDAVYFFLHFQYNGFFTFTVLALIYKTLERHNLHANKGRLVFYLLHLSCVPAYFLSVLWHKPLLVFNVAGGLAAGLQVTAVFYFMKDAAFFSCKSKMVRFLFRLALFAWVLKNMLQLFSAFPAIAAIGYMYRNFVIAYLHLVLLGFISMFAWVMVFHLFSLQISKAMRIGVVFFLLAFFITELLLAVSAAADLLGCNLPHLATCLFLFSCLFPIGVLILLIEIKKQLQMKYIA
jgi:hypothetical protein